MLFLIRLVPVIIYGTNSTLTKRELSNAFFLLFTILIILDLNRQSSSNTLRNYVDFNGTYAHR